MCAPLEARVSATHRLDSIKTGEENMLKQFLQEEQGMEMVEWALVAVLFAVASVAAWAALGGQLTATLQDLTGQIAGA